VIRVIARLLGVVLICAGAWIAWTQYDAHEPYLRATPGVLIEIAPNTRTAQIAQELQDNGIVRSARTFMVLHYLEPWQTLKAGSYSFDRPLSPHDVFRKLARGEVSYETLTVPEGFNRFQIADLVESGGFASRAEFLKATQENSLISDIDPMAPSLEGYLFPDTYQFPHHTGAAAIAKVMVNRFRQVYAKLAAPGLDRPVREVVIMASLVEGETGDAEERPIIASVFYNRLKAGIPLQCDPTVIYAAILSNTYDGTIHQSQLSSPSPYNTYTHAGLPPGAIGNPGRASLMAAMHPAESKYLYFVANSTGHHTFSRTLAEHHLAVNLYRRSLAR